MQQEEKNMIGAESADLDSDRAERTYRNEAGKSEKDGDEEKENQREKKSRKSQKKSLQKTPSRKKNGSQKSNKSQQKSSKLGKGGRSGKSAGRKSGKSGKSRESRSNQGSVVKTPQQGAGSKKEGVVRSRQDGVRSRQEGIRNKQGSVKSGKNKKRGLQKGDGKNKKGKKKGGNNGMRKIGDEDMEKSRMSMSICGGGIRLWLVLLALHSFVVPVFLVVIDSITWIRAELALYIIMLVLNWTIGVLTFIVLFMKSSDGRRRLAFLLIVGRLCCLVLAAVSLIMAFVIMFKPKYAYKYGAWPLSWWVAWVGLLVLSGIDIALQTMGIIVAYKIWLYFKKEEESNDDE
ncbi:hypothetical protein WR25_06047 [Diploscapter pachys]|uniref:Uncharacterized protein n=1 Tax=Diploscapter pachys TaxID=2018661 RepID=A0A2A2J240_9BILA|nr:hypothetical protein WR25_06047 [Diploscapter pachys]